MTQVGKDTLGTRSTLTVNGKDYAYYSFAKAAEKYFQRQTDPGF